MKHYIIIAFLFISIQLAAQPCENLVGIKAGYSSGISFTHYFNRDAAAEIQALYNTNGFQASIFYKHEFSPYAKKQLYYFFGAGPYGGNWDNETAIGASVLCGAEYFFRKAPIGIGVEWKPMVNLYKNIDFAIPDIGATLKVIIN